MDLSKVVRCVAGKGGYKIHALIRSLTLNSLPGAGNPTSTLLCVWWAPVFPDQPGFGMWGAWGSLGLVSMQG